MTKSDDLAAYPWLVSWFPSCLVNQPDEEFAGVIRLQATKHTFCDRLVSDVQQKKGCEGRAEWSHSQNSPFASACLVLSRTNKRGCSYTRPGLAVAISHPVPSEEIVEKSSKAGTAGACVQFHELDPDQNGDCSPQRRLRDCLIVLDVHSDMSQHPSLASCWVWFLKQVAVLTWSSM